MDDRREEEFGNNQEGSARPIGELCYDLFREAIEARATEIHIRPVVEHLKEPEMRLRLRVAGELVPGTTELPWLFYRHLISRFKKMSSMDVAERRSPQTGSLKFKYDGQVYNMTLQIQPIHEFESCVIYLTGKDP